MAGSSSTTHPKCGDRDQTFDGTKNCSQNSRARFEPKRTKSLHRQNIKNKKKTNSKSRENRPVTAILGKKRAASRLIRMLGTKPHTHTRKHTREHANRERERERDSTGGAVDHRAPASGVTGAGRPAPASQTRPK